MFLCNFRHAHSFLFLKKMKFQELKPTSIITLRTLRGLHRRQPQWTDRKHNVNIFTYRVSNHPLHKKTSNTEDTFLFTHFFNIS